MGNTMIQWDALSRADRYIRKSEQRIATRILLIERMRRCGYDARRAERQLQSMQAMLEAWHAHRDEVLRAPSHTSVAEVVRDCVQLPRISQCHP